MEAYDNQLIDMKNELSKLPTIEEKLTAITTTLENLSIQTDKNQQMMLMLMETVTKERTTMGDRKVEPGLRETMTM